MATLPTFAVASAFLALMGIGDLQGFLPIFEYASAKMVYVNCISIIRKQHVEQIHLVSAHANK